MKHIMLTKYFSDTMAKRDGLFGGLFNDDFFDISTLMNHAFNGNVQSYSRSFRCTENETGMSIEIDLPGVKPGDVNVSVHDRIATITYTQRGVKGEQRFSIRSDYDASKCGAKLEHGVLELKFPKVEIPKGQTIKVEVK